MIGISHSVIQILQGDAQMQNACDINYFHMLQQSYISTLFIPAIPADSKITVPESRITFQ